MIVYVVAWHYNGGAGFNWYRNESAADAAFEREKENAREFALDDWRAYRFDFKTDFATADVITDLIDRDIDELCVGSDERAIDRKEFTVVQ